MSEDPLVRFHTRVLRKSRGRQGESESVEWLRNLRTKLQREEGSYEYPHISLEDWSEFMLLAPLFPAEAHNAEFAIGFGVTLWNFPPAPGVGRDHMERLCTVTTSHLSPELRERLGVWEDRCNASFYAGWEIFSPITHRPQNIEWCKMFGLRVPASKNYYDY